jgi:hypothetical protein
MGPYRLPPERSLAEHWQEIKNTPRRKLIAAVVLWALLLLVTAAAIWQLYGRPHAG